MCIFSGQIKDVSQTKIFCRLSGVRQYLVYEMQLATDSDTAMILPLPTPPGEDNAVSFISLQEYDGFFDDLKKCFPAPRLRFRGIDVALLASGGVYSLPVHRVGKFDASWIPSMRDFSRIDPRFRLSEAVWNNLPVYGDYSFAVFQLRRGESTIHPMALSFLSRNPGALYYPTSHVHDGEVHSTADFDHVFYGQGRDFDSEWQSSVRLPKDVMLSDFLTSHKTSDVIDQDAPAYRMIRMGTFDNQDLWV